MKQTAEGCPAGGIMAGENEFMVTYFKEPWPIAFEILLLWNENYKNLRVEKTTLKTQRKYSANIVILY